MPKVTRTKAAKSKSPSRVSKPSKPAAAKAIKSKPKAAKKSAAYYLALTKDGPSISRTPDKQGAVAFDTFEDARGYAAEILIEIIEQLERRLWDTKRSLTFEDYRALTDT